MKSRSSRILLIAAILALAALVVIYKIGRTTPPRGHARTPVTAPAQPRPAAPAAQPAAAPASIAEPASARPALTATPSAAPLPLAATDPAAFVASLSDKELTALIRLLRRHEAERKGPADPYIFPADVRLKILFSNGALKLTDGQNQQIDQIRATYKSRLDVLLAEQKVSALQPQAAAIAQPLYEQYAAAVRTVLTPEQLSNFDKTNLDRLSAGRISGN